MGEEEGGEAGGVRGEEESWERRRGGEQEQVEAATITHQPQLHHLLICDLDMLQVQHVAYTVQGAHLLQLGAVDAVDVVINNDQAPQAHSLLRLRGQHKGEGAGHHATQQGLVEGWR